MAAPPPAKRMRLTYPDPEPDSDNNQDDDELVFEPEEVSERREPEYQLTRQRIKAGNRFEQTMQSIFAKYERDFSLVGDEIDLMTGDIVVDNGHLKSLQYEGDVGVDEEEEDEGIPLGDLMDEEELDSEEEERIMHGQEISSGNALVHVGGSALKPKPRTQPSDRAIQAPFLGVSSVWALGRDYVDDWTTPVPGKRVGTVANLRKTVPRGLEPHTEINPFEEEDDLLDAYQSSKPSPEIDIETSAPSRVVTMRAMRGPLEQIQPTPKAKSSKHKPASKRSSAKRLPARKSSPQPTLYNQLVVVSQQDEMPPVDPNCRRSSRARRQTDFLGDKVSWADVMSGETNSSSNFVVEISSPTLRKEDYVSINESEDEHGLPTPPDSGPEMDEETQQEWKKRIIPDSQESTKSSPRTRKPQDTASESDEDVGVQYATNKPSFELSDDEAPVLFTKRAKPTKKPKSPRPPPTSAIVDDKMAEETVQSEPPTSAAELQTKNKDAGATLPPQQQSSENEAASNGHPATIPSTSQTAQSLEEFGAEASVEPAVEPVPLDASTKESQPRGRGRPRKHPQKAGEEHDKTERMKSQPKRRGRPRKSSPSKSDGLGQEVADSQEDVEPEEPSNVISRSEPIKRPRGRPQTREQRIEDLTDAHPSIEAEVATDKPRDIDHPEAAAPEPTTQPLSSNHTVPDSTADPTSSASVQPNSTPSRTQKHPISNSPKPSTPRHTALRTSKTPTSRRSILSLLSNDEDSDSTSDELLRSDDLPRLFNSPSAKRTQYHSQKKKEKTWKATPLTTEIFRTPIKKKRRRDEEKGDSVRTPGGTTRTCGVDGYRCGRDFCFNCL